MTISDVRNGTFDDFLPLRSLVTPLLTVYLDAVEGGRVERKVVEDGAFVQKGQLLAVLDAMKMEHRLLAPCAGKVAQVTVGEGDRVVAGQILVELAP